MNKVIFWIVCGLGFVCFLLALMLIFMRGSPSPRSPAKPRLTTLVSSVPTATPAAVSREERAMRRQSLIEGLKKRFSEAQLRSLARRSVAIEDAARDALGETEDAYARMREGWSKLCAEEKLSEDERDVLEDEAIRKGWLDAPGD